MCISLELKAILRDKILCNFKIRRHRGKEDGPSNPIKNSCEQTVLSELTDPQNKDLSNDNNEYIYIYI